MTSTSDAIQSKAQQLATWLVDESIKGVGPLCSAQQLATEYLNDRSYRNNEARIDALINWETSKNFTSGFLTGLGGVVTLPIAIPAALGASWIVQARMSAAIAAICGHNIKEDRVKTLVLLSLFGNSIKDILKGAGVQIGQKALRAAISQIPGRVLIEINKKVGFRLLTKAGEKGVINLMKLVPVAGGLVGGTVDLIGCQITGKWAKKIFFEESV